MREPITLLIDIMLRKCENLPIFALWKSACVCYELLHLEDELRHLREERRTNVAPRLCLVMSVNFSAWNSGGNRCRKKGKKRSSTAGCEKQRVSLFFFFLAVRRIYGLVGRNLAVALTPLSRGPLYTLIYIRTKALQLASRMLPASFFVLARGIMGGTFARWCAHICRIVNIYEVYGGGEGGRMKNHWQISDGLCASPRSREFIGNASYDCWRRTFAEQRDGHLRPCISPSSVLYKIWNR